MTISELIYKLNDIRAEYGDLLVVTPGFDESDPLDLAPPKPVRVVEQPKGVYRYRLEPHQINAVCLDFDEHPDDKWR